MWFRSPSGNSVTVPVDVTDEASLNEIFDGVFDFMEGANGTGSDAITEKLDY